MIIKQIQMKELLLGGVSFYGDPFTKKSGWDEDNEIGRTWKRLVKYQNEFPNRTYVANTSFQYEVHIYNEDTRKNGIFEVFIGEEVNTGIIPYQLNLKHLPQSDYLQITLKGNEIISDWGMRLFIEILPERGLQLKHQYIIQRYDERFLGMDQIEASELEAFIPVEKVK